MVAFEGAFHREGAIFKYQKFWNSNSKVRPKMRIKSPKIFEKVEIGTPKNVKCTNYDGTDQNSKFRL